LPVAEVQALLTPDEALLFVHAGKQQTHVWSITPTRAAWHRVGLGRAGITETVTLTRQTLAQADLIRSAVALVEEFSAPRRPGFDTVPASFLYSELLRPHEENLSGVLHLFTVVDGPLAGLPLSLLITDWTVEAMRPTPSGCRCRAAMRWSIWVVSTRLMRWHS
jgi:hypothetical protein